MKLSLVCRQSISRFTLPFTSDALSKTPRFPVKKHSAGEASAFVDYKKVDCVGGDGGNGLISFLREYKVPFGGPDGGNGGNGGHVIFKATSKTKDLSCLSGVVKAQRGENGGNKCCHGKNAPHEVITLPPYSIIKDAADKIVYELVQEDEVFIAARGGAGGHGNNFYLTNQVRKPIKAELGGKGERLSYTIEMRIMATAGLIGFPNVGKSTLLRSISRAKPKVASYPFTTLKPHVGIVNYDDFEQVAVADIPGLIEGANRNVGLGFNFLKHVQRCYALFFVIDYGIGMWREQFDALCDELKLYDAKLLDKKITIVINKIDLMTDEHERQRLRNMFQDYSDVFFISAKESLGLIPVMKHLRVRHDVLRMEQQQTTRPRRFDFIES